MGLPSNALIQDALQPYGVPVDVELTIRMRAYIALLLKWNRTTSLTTVTEPLEIVRFHFGESLFAVSSHRLAQSRLADVGSGAGFPGIPLALAVPSLSVTLIESNTKKCAFLSEVIRELRLSNVAVFRGRMTDFPSASVPFDFVTARALGQHHDLLAWSRDRLTASGDILLWIGAADADLLSKVPGWHWDKPTLLPGSNRRYLLMGSPMR